MATLRSIRLPMRRNTGFILRCRTFDVRRSSRLKDNGVFRLYTLPSIQPHRIPRPLIGPDLLQLASFDAGQHLLMIRGRINLILQVGRIAFIVQRRLAVVVQPGRVVIVMPVAGRRPGAHGQVHHGIHAEEGNLVLIMNASAIVEDQSFSWRRINHYRIAEGRVVEGWIYEGDQYTADIVFG